MAARRIARGLYARASASPALRGPVEALRSSPRVRSFARRHVDVLLARGSTWANVDGALRLVAEDPAQRVVFGPWRGDLLGELLYWAPFVRWAQRHFELDPERTTAISRGGVGRWYAGCRYMEVEDAAESLADAAVIRPAPVLALVEEYRRGTAAPRPLLKRALHEALSPPAAGAEADGSVALALGPAAAFPGSSRNRELAAALAGRLSAAGATVSLEPDAAPGAQHALLSGARGLVAAWSGTAVLGVLSGVPTLALRSADGQVREPDVDLALRVAARVGTPLVVLDAEQAEPLATALA